LEVTAKFRRRNWVWTRIENVDRDKSLLPVPPVQPAGPPCLLCGLIPRPISIVDEPEKPISSPHIVLDPNGVPVTIEEIPIGRVQAYTLGYERELPVGLRWLNIGLGVQVTAYTLPSNLKPVYGNHPSTVTAFLRLRPAGNMQEHMKQMHR
jgi:hypothetical protein